LSTVVASLPSRCCSYKYSHKLPLPGVMPVGLANNAGVNAIGTSVSEPVSAAPPSSSGLRETTLSFSKLQGLPSGPVHPRRSVSSASNVLVNCLQMRGKGAVEVGEHAHRKRVNKRPKNHCSSGTYWYH
jgi:hypothetical protein